MPTIQEAVVINRPRSGVFGFAADPTNVPGDNSNPVELAETGEGPVGEGTTYRVVANVAGRSLAWTAEVLGSEQGSRGVNRSVGTAMAFGIDVTSEDADHGMSSSGVRRPQISAGSSGSSLIRRSSACTARTGRRI
jgi:hypothetical protein